MQGGDHSTDPERPLETEPDVSRDRKQCQDGSDHAGADQLAADAWTNHFDPAVLNPGAQRLTRQLDYLFLRCVTAGLARQPDQHVGRRTEALQRGVADM